ncbi:LOW QUALITY PROTEIN: salivary peroxidase/catechol oxidase [Lepeophtheirus salmonis]|uniref:LOW QUALITY PROTEIN: salivary peroxidase/catechol oxidase n=1 Tax=Lepeophtheirus salmonis TaxID=72036 RepID=UPI003AF3B7D1
MCCYLKICLILLAMASKSTKSQSSSSDQISTQDLLNLITNFGLNRSRQLIENEELRLFNNNVVLEKNNPAHYVAVFNKQKKRSKEMSEFGYASIQASALMAKQFKLTRREVVYGLERVELRNTRLFQECPFRDSDNEITSNRFPRQDSTNFRRSVCEKQTQIYRSVSGICNNLDHPSWGSAFMPFYRFLPADYSDGIQSIRRSTMGGPLPSPRKISAAIHKKSSAETNQFTMMVMQWGQFLDHDLTSTPQTRGFNDSILQCCNGDGANLRDSDLHPDCMPIDIPHDDYFYSSFGARCMEFVRSSPSARLGCTLGPREQVNQITSFLDGSNVYGSSEDDEKSLRLYISGKLRYTDLHIRKALLPPLESTVANEECHITTKNLHCFHAGDQRANEQPGLTGMHTIWLRFHNHIAQKLSRLNTHWEDEKIYQETRKIVGALLQHITYNEWLPVILGPKVLEIFELKLLTKEYYKQYNKSVNPTIANAFAAAAFRFGHSLVKGSISRCNKEFKTVPFFVKLHKEFNNPMNLHNFGSVDRILLGLLTEKAAKRDEFISEELTNRLFQIPLTHYGMDLASLNIQRGRDHGIPSYNVWREQCGLKRFNRWSEAFSVIAPSTIERLSGVYEDFDDVDLFTGGLAEHRVAGGLVGPTLACILGQQFLNLRQGDRFWYENGDHPGAFSKEQLQEIRRVTLSGVICDTLDDIDNIQPYSFLTNEALRNERIPCSKIPRLRLDAWSETSFVFRNEFLQFRQGTYNPDLSEALKSTLSVLNESISLFDIGNYFSDVDDYDIEEEVEGDIQEFPHRITSDTYFHALDKAQSELVFDEEDRFARVDGYRGFKDVEKSVKQNKLDSIIEELFQGYTF